MVLTRDQIEDFIPQRPPFLFLDEVSSLSAERVVAAYHAAPSASFFLGHYPGDPVMPGVLLCECAFQAGALLLAHRGRLTGRATPVLTRIRDARFKRMVRPGAHLRIEVTCAEDLQEACYLLGRVFLGDDLAVRVDFAVMLAHPSEGQSRT